MSHLSKIAIPIFLHHFLITSKGFILMQTVLQLDIWLQSYEGFVNVKNNIKQGILNSVFANISTTIWPTFDSFLFHITSPNSTFIYHSRIVLFAKRTKTKVTMVTSYAIIQQSGIEHNNNCYRIESRNMHQIIR